MTKSHAPSLAGSSMYSDVPCRQRTELFIYSAFALVILRFAWLYTGGHDELCFRMQEDFT